MPHRDDFLHILPMVTDDDAKRARRERTILRKVREQEEEDAEFLRPARSAEFLPSPEPRFAQETRRALELRTEPTPSAEARRAIQTRRAQQAAPSADRERFVGPEVDLGRARTPEERAFLAEQATARRDRARGLQGQPTEAEERQRLGRGLAGGLETGGVLAQEFIRAPSVDPAARPALPGVEPRRPSEETAIERGAEAFRAAEAQKGAPLTMSDRLAIIRQRSRTEELAGPAVASRTPLLGRVVGEPEGEGETFQVRLPSTGQTVELPRQRERFPGEKAAAVLPELLVPATPIEAAAGRALGTAARAAGRGAAATGRAAGRGASEALVRAPGRTLPEAGARLGTGRRVPTGAAELPPEGQRLDVPELPQRGEPQQPTLPSGRTPGGIHRQAPAPEPRDPLGQLQGAMGPEPKPITQGVRDLQQRFLNEAYDRNHPLRELSKRTGRPVHELAQVVPGAHAYAEVIVDKRVKPVLRSIPRKDLRWLETYMVARSAEDRAVRYPGTRLPGGLTGTDPANIVRQMEERLGAKRFSAIRQAADDLWALADRYKLQARRDAGVISDEMYLNLRTTHPHHIPFQRADFEGALAQGFTSPEASLGRAGIKRVTEEGSERALKAPLDHFIADFYRTQLEIARNKAAREIVEAVEQMDPSLVEFVQPRRTLRRAEQVTGERARLSGITSSKKGEHSELRETVSYFKDGEHFIAEIPAEWGQVAKGLGHQPNNLILSVLRTFGQPLRFGATVLNPFFPPVNVMRDALQGLFRENLIPLGPDYLAGMWAVIRKNSLFEEAAESGALLSGVVENMKFAGGGAGKGIPRLGAMEVRNPQDALLLPFRAMQEFNIILERGTRVAGFRKLRNEGLDQLQAAVRGGRDITVDFAKAGHSMQVINQVIPFSNAAVQGTANMFRTIRDHPVRSAGYGAMFTVPTIMARINNMRFETSEDIPDYEYTRNWVLQFGEGTRGDGTKFPIYAKIPKAEIAGMLTFPAEALFNSMRGTEDRGVVEVFLTAALDATRNISPIDPDLRSLGFFPPLGQTAAGAFLGVDPFTRAPLVPRNEQNLPPEQQFGSDTSAASIALGQATGVSPRIIEFAINDFTAGLGQSTNWMLGMGLEALGYQPDTFGEAIAEARDKPEGVEATGKVPGVRRFLGVRDSQRQRRGWAQFQEAIQNTNREFATIPEVTKLGIRLGEAGNTLNVAFGGKGGTIELPPDQRAIYQQAIAEVMVPAVRSAVESLPEDMEPEVKRDAIRRVMNVVRDRTRQSVIDDRVDWQRVLEDLPEDARESAELALWDRRVLSRYWTLPVGDAREQLRQENPLVDVLLVQRFGFRPRHDSRVLQQALAAWRRAFAAQQRAAQAPAQEREPAGVR